MRKRPIYSEVKKYQRLQIRASRKLSNLLHSWNKIKKTIVIYEEIAQQPLNNTLLKYGVRGHILTVGIFQLYKADFVAINKALERYQGLNPTFVATCEYRLIADSTTAIDEKDMSKFIDADKEYESVSQLDGCGINLLSIIFTSCFQNKFTSFMSVYLSGGCIIFEWILAWHIRIHNSFFEVSILFCALRNMGFSDACAAAKKVSGLFEGSGCYIVKHHLLEGNIVSAQILFFTCLCGIIASTGGGKASEGVFIGVLQSMPTTAVVHKLLMEKSSTNAPHLQVIIDTLILQDCVVGMLIVMLPILGGISSVIQGVNSMTKSLLVFIALLKSMISLSTQTNGPYQLVSAAFCLLVSRCSDKLGLGLKWGSFVAQVMVDTTQHTLEQVELIRNMFAALFLSNIGMLIHAHFLRNHVDILLASVILVIIVKTKELRGSHHLEDKVNFEGEGNDTTLGPSGDLIQPTTQSRHNEVIPDGPTLEIRCPIRTRSDLPMNE